jgi:hypothetical protein
MRYCTDENDPGYQNWRTAIDRGAVVLVFLNGEEVNDVDLVDEEAGIIRRAKRDAQGRIMLNGNEIATETLHGAVVTVVKDRDRADH